MKLKTIIKNCGVEPEKIPVPSNSGLKGYAGVAMQKLGIKREDERVVEFRGEDIPRLCDEFTEQGIPAFGLTGDDLFDEYRLRTPGSNLRVIDTTDWYDEKARYGRPTLCFIGKNGAEIKGNLSIAINNKYKATALLYLREESEENGFEFNARFYDGKTEETVANRLNDFCIDTVYSGSTIGEYGLKVMDIIRQSDVVLITSWQEESLDNVFAREWRNIKDRIKNLKAGSYTSELASDPEKATRKFAEESYELLRAFMTGKNLVGETADIIYASIIMAQLGGVGLDQLREEMKRRQK